MRAELWEMLGEPTDLDPATVAGAAKLDRWLNEGQRKIADWKFPDGRLVRFPVLQKTVYWKSIVKTGTLSGGTVSYATFSGVDAQIGTEDDRYNGWVLEITGGTGSGQVRLIVDYAGAGKNAYVNDDFDTAPDGTSTYEISKRFASCLGATSPWVSEHLPLDPNMEVVDIMKVSDMEGLTDLDEAERTEAFTSGMLDKGTPSSWYYFGNDLVLDMASDEAIWYKIEYYGQPRAMVAITDVPSIPDPWHQGIVLWARWWGFARGQETAMSYSAKKDLESFMMTTRQSFEMRYERAAATAVPER
jgi:hypothetical protein